MNKLLTVGTNFYLIFHRFRKAFPALTVQARSQRPVPGASAKRAELDQKVLLIKQGCLFMNSIFFAKSS